MSQFWAVFLLCGLLTPSQGLLGNIPLVSRVDKDAVEKAITGSLTKGNFLQGLLDGLLGGDQLSSLLGGGLLGGDILGSGLLGGDGLGGGLLGGGGLGGGLLGGDGLGGGLLGKQGLLGAVQGLTGLKIVNITLPQITLRFLPGIGLQLNLYTQLTIDGGFATGGLLRAQVKANVTARARLAQDASGALKLVIEDCRTLLGDINIRVGPKLPVLDQALKGVLGSALPKLLCPVIDTVLGAVNSLLGTVTSVLPLGALGTLQYALGSLPVIGDESLQLDLNLLVRDAEGNVVEQRPGTAAPVLPPPAAGVSQLGLSQTALGAMLDLVRRHGAFDTDVAVADSAGPAGALLSTSALRSLLPQLSAAIPESLPLVLRVRSAGAPAVSLRNGKATARVAAALAVLARRPGAAPQPLFTLDADIDMNVGASLSGNKLQAALAVDSVTLRQADSRIGNISVSLLEGWVKDVLEAAYLPGINKALSVGIPLPNLFNVSLEGADVDVVDNAFVISQTRRAA
ncbi:BPI fold-containing family B member 3 [Rhea pennata]|uniref:BPI fold-containing family B member 3 n=1 Tax=Rhea pennata TaxID=8795 RepID=UPI002E26E56D